MTDETISPLRRRMIEDMTIRKLGAKTQAGYIRTVKNLADFLGHSPGGVLLLAAQPTGMLPEFGAAQQSWIDNIGADRLADHLHVRGGTINFSSFERQIEFGRGDGAFVILMGLETIQPMSCGPSAGLVR